MEAAVCRLQESATTISTSCLFSFSSLFLSHFAWCFPCACTSASAAASCCNRSSANLPVKCLIILNLFDPCRNPVSLKCIFGRRRNPIFRIDFKGFSASFPDYGLWIEKASGLRFSLLESDSIKSKKLGRGDLHETFMMGISSFPSSSPSEKGCIVENMNVQCIPGPFS